MKKGIWGGIILFCMTARADRVSVTLRADWLFCKDAAETNRFQTADLNDDAWTAVTLPHDWAIAGPFDPKGDGNTGKLPWRGVGWYRKHLFLPAPADGTRVYLDFDGVMANPEVYVNGQHAGGWDYGYMGFRVDATPYVRTGQTNCIAVRADTRDHRSRWYPGAGIYRKVTLTQCAPVHVAYGATAVTTPEAAQQNARVRVATAVTNTLPRPIAARVTVMLLDPEGASAGEQTRDVRLAPGGETPCDLLFDVPNPRLWDMDAPRLYQARIRVTAPPASADTETVRFGIRSFAFPSDDGFHLNGRRVQLKGVDLHADLGVLGMAFNRSAMKRQLEIMRDMGFNALRTSHNCPAPEVLDLCDEMGIFVWDECFDKWDGTSGRRPDQSLEAYVSRNLQPFVRRDRNHPCVFVWSIGNEIPPANPEKKDDPGMTGDRCALFRSVIRELDATRPVGIGCCHGNAIGRGVFDALDITGWNYGGQYANMKRAYPDKPVLYSESASALSSYGYYAIPQAISKTDYALADLEVSSYDRNAASWSDIPDHEFARMARDRYCGGEFVWTGIDYLGEPTPYAHAPKQMKNLPNERLARSSYFGIADLCGIPKDRFYLYRSLWNTNSVTLHILPHWNWEGREGQPIPVYVYTSGDSAELFLNGKSLGFRTKGQAQPKPENLAAGKPARASTEENGAHRNPAALALDGEANTRWCASRPETNQWWEVDLGKPTAFRHLALSFEYEPAGYAYEILTSDDAQTWSRLFTKALGDETEALLDKPATCRYLRVRFTGLGNGRWASIRECILSNHPATFANPYYDICDTYRLRWNDVIYAPGELKAIAYQEGRKIAESVMRTAGPATAVRLTPEHDTVPPDGESVVFVQVDVTDARGTRAPRATCEIRFALNGPGEVVAVGNGNPRATDSFAETSRHPLYFGKAVAVVRRRAGQTAPLTLTASADGLTPAVVTLH